MLEHRERHRASWEEKEREQSPSLRCAILASVQSHQWEQFPRSLINNHVMLGRLFYIFDKC